MTVWTCGGIGVADIYYRRNICPIAFGMIDACFLRL